jgi:type VI protein secretion system component VasK
MTETIIVAAFSLCGTLVGAYMANRKSTALIAYRLEQLEDKVNKHNSVIERTYALEERVSVDEQKIAHLEQLH